MSRLLYQAELHRRADHAVRCCSQSPFTESNRRPSPYHGDALPTELRGRTRTRTRGENSLTGVARTPNGLYPTASAKPKSGSPIRCPADGQPLAEVRTCKSLGDRTGERPPRLLK